MESLSEDYVKHLVLMKEIDKKTENLEVCFWFLLKSGSSAFYKSRAFKKIMFADCTSKQL